MKYLIKYSFEFAVDWQLRIRSRNYSQIAKQSMDWQWDKKYVSNFCYYVLAVIIDMNVDTPDSYYCARAAFEIMDTHIINIYGEINRVELSEFPATKIITFLMYVAPSILYTFRILFQISLNYAVLTNIVELLHLITIYAYFIINIIL